MRGPLLHNTVLIYAKTCTAMALIYTDSPVSLGHSCMSCFSSGFLTKSDLQPQKITRDLKFWIEKVEELYYLCSENKNPDQSAQLPHS